MAGTPLQHQILRAWQRIEFFQPYTLEEKDKCLRISCSQLIKYGDALLPWHSEELCQQYQIPSKANFTLHIGLFDKSIASKISRKVFGEDDEECEQRLNQEGTTCFAKVQLNQEGVPAIDRLSVSSLPWALGHLQNKRFQKLESVIFANGCMRLADTLSAFSNTLKPLQEKGLGVLRSGDILTLLLTHLVEWADFKPEWQYAIQIEWSESKVVKQETQQEDATDEEEDSEKLFALPILNSFFFEDLEYANAVLNNNKGKALDKYLSQCVDRKPDLYSQAGLASIIKSLHPAKMPQGRWPAEPDHAMSLMQQFAINTAVEELAEGGILSVNGPPGTGKTTLLRDLIAHNIVERAKVLARFNKIEDTLDPQGFIVPELTGFEMVVASSNNAAVENISKELPQKKSLAKEFQTFEYLFPTANQIAAEYLPKRHRKIFKSQSGKEKEFHIFRPLEEEKQCWGLISVALGKKSNREKLAQRLFFDEHFLRDTPAETQRPEKENFLNLWRWKACLNKLSFADAKNNFNKCLEKVEEQQKSLEKYSALLEEKPDNTLANLIMEMADITAKCEENLSELGHLEAERDIVSKKIQYTTRQQKLIESEAPGWLDRLCKGKKYRSHQELLRAIKSQLFELNAQLIEKMTSVADSNVKLMKKQTAKREAQLKIDKINKQIIKQEQALEALQNRFHRVMVPDRKLSINNANLQRTAFWQNGEINRLRSELFLAAMNLHQAWLYQAMGLRHFRDFIFTLSTFLSAPHKHPSPIRCWQTLSMFVPVLSTTFASVSRMLSGVKSEEIGWLMIDEAGQASPQQAVGAILRAKRVLVVGDPLQIEPVFTASPALVKRLCEDVMQEQAKNWNPAKFSVQQLADRVNHWGCELEVMNSNIWIGVPLWVHRRCIEPMFSIANRLAYNNRMIHGLPSEKIRCQLVNNNLENHWLVSSGGQGERQYRDSHGKSLLILLDRLLCENISLESIYVITPFKVVKSEISKLIEQRSLRIWQQSSPSITSKAIKEWQKRCIGTVHTFQGKENDIVILILGCDEQNDGGAKWASSKPNLLNVAVTRAKKNIFVIGDPSVWNILPGFNSIYDTLKELQPDDILTVNASEQLF
ncbi:DEAD/DEAH box helicase [Silvania hatchlandensis]|uniref:AAA domain-containing protein n=1 Tax=Silvania hatchlandensis TaxID=2926469 RepID=A0A9J6QB35_9ENTR|nr:AAA domain-containing protein [Silvania hatchlandensis]MCU6665661.1 AAA domain-containing protein [Silvania hatchlandensis]